jgi:hypothetical protein
MELTQTAQIVFTTLFALIVFFTHPPQENHIANGDYYYRAFDNESAQKEYELAYHDSPKSYACLLHLVRIHNDNGRIHLRKDSLSELEYKMAVVFADSLAYNYPDSAAAHFWYALAKGSLIPFVGVREKIAIEREYAKLGWLEKGIVRVIFGEDLSGSLEASEEYLKTALRYDSSNSFANYELFWTYKAMGNLPKAKFSLQEVIKRIPKNLREKQQQDEALEYLAELSSPPQVN